MAKYRLTKKAVDDLSDIWNYTCERWSERQADSYYFSLLNACDEIAENPGKGKNYETIHPGLFGYKIYQHIVFYTLTKTGIEVVRILHSRMDLRNRLND